MWLHRYRIVKTHLGLTPISLERLKPETSNLVYASTMRSNFDGTQKLGHRGRDPV